MSRKRKNEWLIGNKYGAKPVLDLHTGILWNSADELAAVLGIKPNTMNKRLKVNREGRYLRMNQQQAKTLNKGKHNELSGFRIN